jgi:hypothetical protein
VSGEWRFTDKPYSEVDYPLTLTSAAQVAQAPGGDRAASTWWRTVAYLGTVVVAVGLAVVHGRGPSTPVPRPRVALPSNPATASASPMSAGSVDPLRDLKVQAYLVGPLTDYLRAASGSRTCLTVPPGHAPRSAIAGAIRRVLPQVSVVDSSAIMDEFAALCSIELRARDRSGTIAVVTVTVPSGARSGAQRTTLSTAADAIGGTTSTLVRAVTATGWTIRVGATGPATFQPSVRELAALARNPTLTW